MAEAEEDALPGTPPPEEEEVDHVKKAVEAAGHRLTGLGLGSGTSMGAELDLEGNRHKVGKMIDGLSGKIIMGIVISLNALQVIYESDIGALCKWDKDQDACDQESGWLFVTNWLYLIIYTFEMALRIYAYRFEVLTSSWDMFDMFIIVAGFIGEIVGGIIPSTGILRLFRLARLARAMHMVKLPKEWHIMIHGFISAIKAITIGCGLVFVMMALWGVVAVAFLNDVNHEQGLLDRYEKDGCGDWGPKAWSSVSNSVFTFTQLLIMGEGWACYAVPITERNPWAMVIFMAVFFTVVHGMTNLILAVIVDKALQVHEADVKEQAKQRMKERTNASKQFVSVCRDMDADASGSLTLDEMVEGYEAEGGFFHTLQVMDVGKEDLELLFNMMDRDKSGFVSYEEFGKQLSKLNVENVQTMLNFIEHRILEVEDIASTVLLTVKGIDNGLQQASVAASRDPRAEEQDATLLMAAAIKGKDVKQMRVQLEAKALEACYLLEKQALVKAETEQAAADFARALQAHTIENTPPPVWISDPIVHAAVVEKNSALAEVRASPYSATNTNVGNISSKPLLDELRRVEFRLMQEFGRLHQAFSPPPRSGADLKSGLLKNMCMTDTRPPADVNRMPMPVITPTYPAYLHTLRPV